MAPPPRRPRISPSCPAPVLLALSLADRSGYLRRHLHCPLSPISPINSAVLRIVRHPGPQSNHPRGAVLAMGNFDGLHRGHAALVDQVRSLAGAAGVPSAVLT